MTVAGHDGGRGMAGRGFRVLTAAIFVVLVAVNAACFGLSELLRRLGPPPLGEAVTFSKLVVDRDGRLLRPFPPAGGTWRLPAPPRDVDPRFLAMLIAYEDKRFYRHIGVDLQALGRA